MNEWILPDKRGYVENSAINQQSKDSTDFQKENLQPNYVLIDAALWGTDINILFLDENTIYRSLFRGSTGEKLWSAAPYLVDISSNEGLVKKIKEKDPIERRVTWLSSSLNIDELRKHLRHFLRMKREDKSYIYFRFYDPFVVNTVFPNLTSEQLTDFFKNIDHIITDDIRTNERHVFYMSSEQELEIIHQTL